MASDSATAMYYHHHRYVHVRNQCLAGPKSTPPFLLAHATPPCSERARKHAPRCGVLRRQEAASAAPGSPSGGGVLVVSRSH